MPKMSKQARAREFNAASRQIIKERDLYQCIFCRMEYHMEDVTWYALPAAEHHALHPEIPRRTRDPAEWCIGLPKSP